MKVAVATAMALAAAALTYAPAASAEEPTRILIVGDSVTQGYRGDYTWRYFLWKALEPAPVSVDFVGRRTGVFNHDNGYGEWDYDGADAYADPNFDQDHGASWGGRLSQQENFLYDPIAPQVAAQQPDVILSLWGINDLGREDIGPADLIDLYRQWATEARSADPTVDLVVGELPSTWLYDGEVTTFNTMLGDLAAELTTPESPFIVARMTEPYAEHVETTDHVHPSIAGQQKIAHMMQAALVKLSPDFAAPVLQPVPTPAPEPVIPPVVAPPVQQVAASTPAAPGKVRATRVGKRLTVTWRKAAGAESYQVRCGSRGTVAVATKATVRGHASRCKVRSVADATMSPWSVAKVRTRR